MSQDELELALRGGGSRVVSADEVGRLDRGTSRRQWGKGFVAGTVLGLTAVTISRWRKPRVEIGAEPLLAGALYGAIGLGIGGLIEREGWEALPGWARGGTTAHGGMTSDLIVDMQPDQFGGTSLILGAQIRF